MWGGGSLINQNTHTDTPLHTDRHHTCLHICMDTHMHHTHTPMPHTHTHHTHTHTHHMNTHTHTHTHTHSHVAHRHTLYALRGWGENEDERPCCLAIREELSLRLAKLNAEPRPGEAEANAPGAFTTIHRTCTIDHSSRATVKFVTSGSPGQQHFHLQQSVW